MRKSDTSLCTGRFVLTLFNGIVSDAEFMQPRLMVVNGECGGILGGSEPGLCNTGLHRENILKTGFFLGPG
jgi:hypothetical protein